MQINRFALADFMEVEGHNLATLARATGISVSFLSMLRNGDRTEISPPKLKAIADTLGVRIRSLAAHPNDVEVAS